MAWDFADDQLHDSIQQLLGERRESAVLQTGFLNVEAKDADTLIITRYAEDGKDVFGTEIGSEKKTIRISRK